MNAQSEQRLKQILRASIGEPYVGKRLKVRNVSRAMPMPTEDGWPRRILDFGAEDATFVYWLADRYPNAVISAVDLDQAAMDVCRDLIPAKYAGRVDFVTDLLPDFLDATASMIVAFDVLEHIEDDRAILAEFVRILEPNGELFIHVPRDQWMDEHGIVTRIPDSEAWTINAGHVRTGYSAERLTEMVADTGLEVVETDMWVRRWGTRAFTFYSRVEDPPVARILSIPFTDLAAVLDRRRPSDEGNTVWLRARKPA
jgi:2-polyprenyl-3-methyl-5-hydroxy-6-metoxy-1,4-benzoquinol methylase